MAQETSTIQPLMVIQNQHMMISKKPAFSTRLKSSTKAIGKKRPRVLSDDLRSPISSSTSIDSDLVSLGDSPNKSLCPKKPSRISQLSKAEEIDDNASVVTEDTEHSSHSPSSTPKKRRFASTIMNSSDNELDLEIDLQHVKQILLPGEDIFVDAIANPNVEKEDLKSYESPKQDIGESSTLSFLTPDRKDIAKLSEDGPISLTESITLELESNCLPSSVGWEKDVNICRFEQSFPVQPDTNSLDWLDRLDRDSSRSIHSHGYQDPSSSKRTYYSIHSRDDDDTVYAIGNYATTYGNKTTSRSRRPKTLVEAGFQVQRLDAGEKKKIFANVNIPVLHGSTHDNVVPAWKKARMQAAQDYEDMICAQIARDEERDETNPEAHITVWNKVEKRKLAGNAAPLRKNLEAYLRNNPQFEVYRGQNLSSGQASKKKATRRKARERVTQEVNRLAGTYLESLVENGIDTTAIKIEYYNVTKSCDECFEENDFVEYCRDCHVLTIRKKYNCEDMFCLLRKKDTTGNQNVANDMNYVATMEEGNSNMPIFGLLPNGEKNHLGVENDRHMNGDDLHFRTDVDISEIEPNLLQLEKVDDRIRV